MLNSLALLFHDVSLCYVEISKYHAILDKAHLSSTTFQNDLHQLPCSTKAIHETLSPKKIGNAVENLCCGCGIFELFTNNE